MKKVLLGAVRSKGEFTMKGVKRKYDNIKLFLADYRNGNWHGFSYEGVLSPVKVGDVSVDIRKIEMVKVPTIDFEEVSGVSLKDFLCNFEKEYMFHKVRVITETNDFDRDIVIELKFSEKTCFALHRELEEKKKDEVEDFDDSEDSADISDDFGSEAEDDFDFDLDKETGKVSVKKVKKGDKSEKT